MRRSLLIGLGVFLAFEGLLASHLWRGFRAESAEALTLMQAELQTAYDSVVRSKGDLVGAVVQQAVDVPAVRVLLDAVSTANADARKRLRGRLYRQLSPTFRILRAHDVRSMHVVLPDGTSFLRLHRPDLYADDIASERPLLARVIETAEPHRAFEHGRVYPGFHYAYPMIQDGRVIAVVDFGVSFDAIARVLGDTGRELGIASRILMRRGTLESVAHPTTHDFFVPAVLHEDFVLEDASSPLGEDLVAGPPLPDWFADVDRALAQRPAALRAMDSGLPYRGHVCLTNDTCFGTVLLPIEDSTRASVAAIAAYAEQPGYAARRNHLGWSFLVGSLLVVAAGTALRHWLASRERLRTIGESMVEGLYVIDPLGKTLYVNRAACDLLGYSCGELLGHNAHAVFHTDETGAETPIDACHMRNATERGEIYRSDAEVFRRRDGSLLRVSLVSSPLREEGRSAGSIVLFRDIGAELEARARLERAEVALRNLSEAVVVTDAAARIQWVNRAFVEITGYSESESMGRNPSFLASGRHDEDYYKDLWASLNNEDTWEGEIWNRRKDGEVYPQWLRINAMRDDAGGLQGFVSVFSDITELRAKEERLRNLAYHDQLTGLYNRTAFLELLGHAMNRARGRGTQVALLYLDLDRFKRINDTLGHAAGDQLLETVAKRLRTALRGADEAARLGGDEFGVLLEDLDQRTTPARIAHDILARVREPSDIDGRPIYATTSIGISVFPQDGEDPHTLLRSADAAMYLAKRQGRDGYRYFSAEMAVEAEQRFELEAALRLALDKDQLRLHYQPQVDLGDGSLIGVEALIRWQHPREGLIGPAWFLDTARDAGLMPKVTEWVLREAAAQCIEWKRAGVRVGRVACNLDALCFPPLTLEALLLQTTHDAGIEPSDLELEIVETAMHPRSEDRGLWERLVAAGFQLAIDDFGTGESSLARLKSLPARTLKIDRSFVADTERSENDRSIVRTIVAMTRTLGRRSLAEGVETAAQLRFLKEIGCDAAQGFYFSKPLPASEIPALAASGSLAAKLAAATAATRLRSA